MESSIVEVKRLINESGNLNQVELKSVRCSSYRVVIQKVILSRSYDDEDLLRWYYKTMSEGNRSKYTLSVSLVKFYSLTLVQILGYKRIE